MVENASTPAVAVDEAKLKELLAQFGGKSLADVIALTKTVEFKAAVASEAAAEKAKLEAKQKALDASRGRIATIFNALVDFLSGFTELDRTDEKGKLRPSEAATEFWRQVHAATQEALLAQAEGVWFSVDFGMALKTMALYKTTEKKPRTGGGGGGKGKKYDISSDAMLEKHKSEVFKDGVSFEVANSEAEKLESKSEKGNAKYQIRKALLKLEGYTK